MGARVVRLGIAGFKSFAEATSIEILPGLTGIVGPNGCGKSNVAEALRWAMGESNARHMRGGEMDDVIFAGTAHRPSRNLAEVSLSVESDETGLPPPFAANAELHVVRRLDRGGGSAYRVNGREARSRDVQTLFADMGSGARSSAMVSQGRVGALVNARPEERRVILEEAAGITGLHARRAEAETRLRAAETNLQRAEERRVLLAAQLEGLRLQATDAVRYRVAVEGALEAEARLLSVQSERARLEVVRASHLLESAREAVKQADTVRASLDGANRERSAALPGLRELESDARTGLERARMAEEAARSEAARAREELGALARRHEEIKRDWAHAQAALNDTEGADQRLSSELAQLREDCEGHPERRARLEADLVQAVAALVGMDQRAMEATSRAAEAEARSAIVSRALVQAETAFQHATGAAETALAQHRRATDESVPPELIAAAEAEVTEAQAAVERARAAHEAAERARPGATARAEALREAFGRVESGRQRLAAEAAGLSDVLAIGDAERWRPMVDRLQVPAGLEGALGAALGVELAAADDPIAARHWRALPVRHDTVPIAGALGAQIDAPPELRRALSAVGLVDREEDGEALQADLAPGHSLVSAQGAFWRWDGYTVRAGTVTPAALRLRQRNRLTALHRGLTEAEAACDAARIAAAEAVEAERVASTAERAAVKELRACEYTLGRSQAARHAMLTRAQHAQTVLLLALEARDRTTRARDDRQVALIAAREAANKLPDPMAERRAADAARAQVTAARLQEAQAQRALDAAESQEHARQRRTSTLGREREDRAMRVLDLRQRAAELARRAIDSEEALERQNGAPEAAARRLQSAMTDRMAAEASWAARVEDVRAAASANDFAAAALAQSERNVAGLQQELIRAEAFVEAAEQAAAVVSGQIGERAGALPPLPPPPDDVSAGSEERARLRFARCVRERDAIGPVNLRAEAEATEIERIVAGIALEQDEIGTAVNKLRGSIGHLNREGRERLMAVFQEVDRNFQALFGRLFGGGRAHLSMVGSDDPLLAGLEIYAQPPGKKLTALSLLSGGEQAMTALSLVFAVFRCNPAPLCVLDEVDAPLDDANVERFCGLLADMAGETGTRFLVVTHHQVTMARMDRLYGVTMQERGVSRMLSVDLGQAVGILDSVAAE